MGDIADMILDGILDEYTGEYIGPAVGYPRSLDPKDYSNQHKKNSKNYGKDPLRGICNWLDGKHLLGSGKDEQYSQRNHRIIERYTLEELQIGGKLSQIAKIISSEHWQEFIKWVKDTYK